MIDNSIFLLPYYNTYLCLRCRPLIIDNKYQRINMEAQGDTVDLSVYFIISSKYENDQECSPDMWEAFHKCTDNNVCPEWITEDQCKKIRPNKSEVYVLETFEGEFFENLQNFKCTIVGPRCLLSCFATGEPIPAGSKPIYNTAMRDMIVCASGFTKKIKDEIQQKVEFMGGIFTKEFRGSVTLLITDSVMSAKYEHGGKLGKTIVTLQWLRAVWDINLNDYVPASDEMFQKYKCPVFLNLIVTSTNVPKRQKEEIKKLITVNGGEFMGVLDGSKVKVVLTFKNSSTSDKLKYAMQNNIACLKLDWVYRSIEAGYALPFSDFLISSTQACSTPEKSEANEPLNISTISIIPNENHPTCIDETIGNTMLSISSFSADRQAIIPSWISTVDKLNISDAKKAGPFLDGCNIYLAGFSVSYREKVNRILSIGSATRLDDISDALTHILVGDPDKAAGEMKMIASKHLCSSPHILRIDWLIESIKLKRPAAEDEFVLIDRKKIPVPSLEPASPLSKRNLQMLQRSTETPELPLRLNAEKTVRKQSTLEDDKELVQQYLYRNSNESNANLQEILPPPHTNIGRINQIEIRQLNSTNTTKQPRKSINDAKDDSAIPVSQDSFANQKIFQGLTFTLIGFDNNGLHSLKTQIEGLGGTTVFNSCSATPNFIIVPLVGAPLKTFSTEIVTELYLEDCIDHEKVMEIAYYHRPLLAFQHTRPLTGCVMGMSSYTGVQRIYLSKLAESLGARYQDTFVRKTNIEKNTYSSTHLICPLPEGNKYNAAVKWKLPAVTAEWLLKCASEMRLVDENAYLVGEAIAPLKVNNNVPSNHLDKSEVVRPPCSSQQTSTPKCESIHKDKIGVDAHIINKRLSTLGQQKIANSPFHVSTPQTPYGQIFGDNPSPKTRKMWAKWIGDFPDISVEEPPQKRRRSTPLSEVKRAAWDFVTGRLDSLTNTNYDSIQTNVTEDCSVRDAKRNTTFSSNTHNESRVNRKLSYEGNEKQPALLNFESQIAKMDQALQKVTNTSESRHSISAKYANQYIENEEPIQRCLAKELQAESVGWEDPAPHILQHQNSTVIEELGENSSVTYSSSKNGHDSLEIKKRKFMFSGIKDRTVIEMIINDLGGSISTESTFDNTATHLLCLKPARNEKILSSIAAGKWILHCAYLEACKEEGTFVNEELYEWGNPSSKGRIPESTNENEILLAHAAHRWRLRLLDTPGGAFHNIIALLLIPKEKYDQFDRLIRAGGGTVVCAKPPYENNGCDKKITHCFIQVNKLDQPVEWAMLASKGILCFHPQYLNDYLMHETSVNPRSCVLPEFQKYLPLIPK